MKLIAYYVDINSRPTTRLLKEGTPNEIFDLIGKEREDLIKEYDFLALKGSTFRFLLIMRLVVNRDNQDMVSSSLEELESWKKEVSGLVTA